MLATGMSAARDPGQMSDLTWPEVKNLFVAAPPLDPTHFGIHVQAFIGSTESESSDSFDVLVCSPRWLMETLANPKADDEDEDPLAWGYRTFPRVITMGAQFWVMDRWDEAEVRRLLEAILAEVGPGPDWGSVASRIARFIPWEYAYRYDEHEQAGGGPFPAPPS